MKNSILNGSEPNPVSVYNQEGASSFLLVCEHASNQIPESLNGLGLGDADLKRHIAWDIGALAVAKSLADKMDAVLVYQNY